MCLFVQRYIYLPTLQAPNLDLRNVIRMFKIMKYEQIIQTVRS